MKKQPIKTAVFPVAGIGTRFLPVTKAGPKEMLPIVDKPLIQYVVEEALEAGITQLVFVTSSSKRAIEDYFDSNYELENILETRKQWDVLSTVKNIVPSHVSVVYIRQNQPLGLGHAVLCAKHVVGNFPFAVLLADDILDSYEEENCLQSMIQLFHQTQASVLAIEEVPKEKTDQYGIVSISENSLGKKIESIVEKPKPIDAPSQLAVMGRYILTPQIFSLLENTAHGVGGELQLTDAIAKLLGQETVLAFPFEGERYDCGTKLGLLKATIAYALKRPDLKEDLMSYLRELI